MISTSFIPVSFVAGTDVVVMGTNPENADITNPRGEYYGFAPFVRVSNEYGDCFMTSAGNTSRDEIEARQKAEQLSNALRTRWEVLGKLPVRFAEWTPTRPVYGSDAYIDYGFDDDRLLESREEEDSYFWS